MKTLQEEKKALEDKLEAQHQDSTQDNDRDKASIIASEKRARGQVSVQLPVCGEW